MLIKSDTVLRLLRNGAIAVTSGHGAGKAEAIIAVGEQFVCGDLYEGYPKDAHEDWYPDFPSDLIQSCDAMRVEFDNGSLCLDGHCHLYEQY
jgi:hypothetical protein